MCVGVFCVSVCAPVCVSVCLCVDLCVCLCQSVCISLCLGGALKISLFGILIYVDETGNIEEMERKFYSNCDQDLEDVTEKEGDGRY